MGKYLDNVGALFVFSGLGGSFLLTPGITIKKRIADIPLYHISLLYLLATISLLIFVRWGNKPFIETGFSLIFAATILLTIQLSVHLVQLVLISSIVERLYTQR